MRRRTSFDDLFCNLLQQTNPFDIINQHWWKEDKWMNEWMNGWMNAWMNECMNEWMNEWMDGWMDGWMNEWNESSISVLVEPIHLLDFRLQSKTSSQLRSQVMNHNCMFEQHCGALLYLGFQNFWQCGAINQFASHFLAIEFEFNAFWIPLNALEFSFRIDLPRCSSM
jgi:hypothetical protein